MKKRKCLCGCGKIVNSKPYMVNKEWVQPRFVSGHYTKWRAKNGLPGFRSWEPVGTEQIPTGLCECGCGQKTNIATYTVQKKRHFKGYPLPHISGHSKKKLREKSHKWKGGRINNRGYILIFLPEHPNADSKGYVPEHRLAMSKKLGRPLTSNEHVHHINGISDDNRIGNLVLLSKSAHLKIHASTAGKKGAEARWGKKRRKK